MAALGRLWRGSSPERLLKAQTHLLNQFQPSSGSSPISPLRTILPSGDTINAIELRADSKQTTNGRTLLLAHGFGAGLGFFGIANLHQLAARYERVVAVDWLGMGGSSRPSCGRAPRLRGSGWLPSLCDSGLTPADAVSWFVGSLDHFVNQNHLTQFDLLGHSLGGYLSAMYACRHPSKVRRLVLASPAGVVTPDPTHVVPTASLPMGMRLIDAAWSKNITPQQLVRAAGSWKGRQLVERAVNARLGKYDWSSAQRHSVAEYLYQISAAPGSGEFAMNSLLTARMVNEQGRMRPRVYAHRSLEQYALPTLLDEGIEPLLIYGDRDWLFDPDLERLGGSFQLEMVGASGHHLYMDNPDVFNQLVLDFCE